jgi:hypothetical protein
MKAMLGLCLSPLDSHPEPGRPVWMEGNVFSLPYNNFSIILSLLQNNELI